ncbi:MAG: branched-chain amino acid aminotransferase [Candidatus Lokiarchaeota archaeon]|nr:branched-chain amino acid aminotransferase [Candidatus Harpocratesius repetitus]
MEIKIKKATELKELPEDDSKLGFGQIFTDHMLYMEFDRAKGGWGPAEIRPYGILGLEPASACLHYGQIVWEGLKCYRTSEGLRLFRPRENFKRLNRSARRMCMPEVDIDYLLAALKELLKLEARWVPKTLGTSLYIRPCMIASEPFLGLHKANRYILFIILSPSGPYFKEGFKPVKILVEDKYVRAAVGGTGEAKTAGNYAASLKSTDEAMEKGFSQTLWLDACERKYIEEVGAMNMAFVINGEVVTPPLHGSILSGITRKSILEICDHIGIKAVERRISIDEVIECIENGTLTEAFGLGTAAIIAPVGSIFYKEENYIINNFEVGPIATKLYEELTGIQYGSKPDIFGWIEKVEE